jgi:hypothetical protein
MDANLIFTGYGYTYRKPKKKGELSYGVFVEAIAVDAAQKSALVKNVNTGKVIQVNTDDLEPIKKRTTP